jgi:hypothetical protein
MTCLHLTASNYAPVTDLKSCDELNGEEENTLQHPQVIALKQCGSNPSHLGPMHITDSSEVPKIVKQ